ncbi:hypothetical protein HU200_052226 [Digitaria exilis]|uniref:Uncharacterized protein n=1 Tax=Digitaria exilis TaxID=1010633 RepID=A0A835ATL8_9POAL|nr:hypothetical protein HU200_052226 [Digitaria exilis]
MARLAAIWVCILIGTMDLSAGLLAMQAQDYENKVRISIEVGTTYLLLHCKEPAFKAFQLCAAAAALHVLAHAVPCILGGCLSQSNSLWAKINRILALFSG